VISLTQALLSRTCVQYTKRCGSRLLRVPRPLALNSLRKQCLNYFDGKTTLEEACVPLRFVYILYNWYTDGIDAVSLTHQPPFKPRNTSGTFRLVATALLRVTCNCARSFV
jgi:hypothetical protein